MNSFTSEFELQAADAYVRAARRRISVLEDRQQRELAEGIANPELDHLLTLMRGVLDTMIEHQAIVAAEARLQREAPHRRPEHPR
ncbi:hypothetical protein [Paraburkholderia sp. RL17-373-BIF-A]|uniref:hypothetical protein n=1 Tax=Paraburkholderia sp. RL17-373-BIF-A TaxID=3031629 RepID=UPI0038BADC23